MNLLAQLLCAALVVLASPAWAQLSRDDAAAVAQRAAGGRILSLERSGAGDRAVWRVKVVTPQGEVRVILIDVATGKML